jgi:hypothetical protein
MTILAAMRRSCRVQAKVPNAVTETGKGNCQHTKKNDNSARHIPCCIPESIAYLLPGDDGLAAPVAQPG